MKENSSVFIDNQLFLFFQETKIMTLFGRKFDPFFLKFNLFNFKTF